MSAKRDAENGDPGDGGQAAGADYARLDDTALISLRRRTRDELEREPANMADLVRAHHLMTLEVLRRTATLRRQGG